MKLSEDLKYWRAERPDEWTMDEFIRKAMALEKDLKESNKYVEDHKESLRGWL